MFTSFHLTMFSPPPRSATPTKRASSYATLPVPSSYLSQPLPLSSSPPPPSLSLSPIAPLSSSPTHVPIVHQTSSLSLTPPASPLLPTQTAPAHPAHPAFTRSATPSAPLVARPQITRSNTATGVLRAHAPLAQGPSLKPRAPRASSPLRRSLHL